MIESVLGLAAYAAAKSGYEYGKRQVQNYQLVLAERRRFDEARAQLHCQIIEATRQMERFG